MQAALASTGVEWTAKALLDVVQRIKHKGPEWLFLKELRFSTGYRGAYAEKRLDGFAMHYWPSHGWERTAYEVKISRSDLLRELKDPKKRRPALAVSNFFYFVTTPGLAKVDEIPPECGLIEVYPEYPVSGKVDPLEYLWGHEAGSFNSYNHARKEPVLRHTVPAVHRDTWAPSWGFVASLVRHAQKG